MKMMLSGGRERGEGQSAASRAVMEFGGSGSSRVMAFSQLAAATDLKEPPRNWLREEAHLPTPAQINKAATARATGHLPSLALADSSLHSLPKVDVITDSESVKKLLKMGFGGPATSMLIHRVGKTLLIDSFDSPRTLIRLQEEDWPWLRDFFASVLAESRPNLSPLAIKADEMEERLILSKFLHHSVAEAPTQALVPAASAQIRGAPIPDPSEQILAAPDTPAQSSSSSQSPGEHERKVLWTFEDMTMLLGTNLPIFGCGTHPCVTLRLRDAAKPINVLTGLDYWLDQLMCNVPEVAMCYHLDGIVQKYEMVATEDLPNLTPNSAFDPAVVRSVAGNLLGFLKDNATKEGHTYWLFKAAEDEVVKLYDLSSICSSLGAVSDGNPFTTPVGYLMYRVGRNLLRDAAEANGEAPVSRGLFNSVYRLLHSALRLLSASEQPRVVGSVHYLLSSLYLAYGTCGGGEAGGEEMEEAGPGWDLAEESWQESKTGPASTSISLDLLRRPAHHSHAATSTAAAASAKPKPLPNSTNLDDCCKAALEHVTLGLECAETPEPSKESGKTSSAIPMGQGDPGEEAATSAEWQRELRGLLLVQAAAAYRLLSSAALSLGNLGKALRQATSAALCLEGVRAEAPPEPSPSAKRCLELERELRSLLLAHLGDFFMLYAKGEPLREQAGLAREAAKEAHFRDAAILARARRAFAAQDEETSLAWATALPQPTPPTLPFLRAKECYEAALKSFRPPAGGVAKFLRFLNGEAGLSRPELLRKLGNALNEAGMCQTKALTEALPSAFESTSSAGGFQDLAQSALGFFRDGIGRFHEAGDAENEALLHSNCGRIARIQSRALLRADSEFSSAERRRLEEALRHYEAALEVLRGGEDLLRESRTAPLVTSELAGTYFSLASQLQERPPLSTTSLGEVQREIISGMEAALRQYSLVLSQWPHLSPLAPAARHRSFTIHYRLASLHHKSWREREDPTQRKAKTAKAAAEREYAAAADCFRQVSAPSLSLRLSFLRLEMERVALLEGELASVEGPPGAAWRERLILQALRLLADSGPVWSTLLDGTEEEDGGGEEARAEAMTVAKLWLERSQVLAKAYLAIGKDSRSGPAELERRKALYKATLCLAQPTPALAAQTAAKMEELLRLPLTS